MIDPKDPYRWVDVRGTVEAIEEDKDYASINAHAKLYVGADEYYGGFAPAEQRGKEERVILKVRAGSGVCVSGVEGALSPQQF